MADAPVLGAGSYGVWVQVPSPAPRRSKVRFAPASFLPTAKKKPSARSLAAPFQITTAPLGRDLGGKRLGK